MWPSRCWQWHRRHLRGLIYGQIPFIYSGNIYALLFWEHLETSPTSGIFMHRRELAMRGRALLCRDPGTVQGTSWASDQAALLSFLLHGRSILRGISFPGCVSACTSAFLMWPYTSKEHGSMYNLTVVPISHLFFILSS